MANKEASLGHFKNNKIDGEVKETLALQTQPSQFTVRACVKSLTGATSKASHSRSRRSHERHNWLNYRCVLLDQNTIPSIRLLSIVHHSLMPGLRIQLDPLERLLGCFAERRDATLPAGVTRALLLDVTRAQPHHWRARLPSLGDR